MFSTLYRKLAAVLLLLFSAAAGLVLAAIVVTTRLHLQEVNQRFNRSLAEHLAAGRELMPRGEVDEAAAAVPNLKAAGQLCPWLRATIRPPFKASPAPAVLDTGTLGGSTW